jgi:hypothetical protein
MAGLPIHLFKLFAVLDEANSGLLSGCVVMLVNGIRGDGVIE